MRIDKLLWYLRFAHTRTMAQKMSAKGHVRLNGRRVDRAHLMVRENDILTIPRGREVHVIRVFRLPERRESAAGAQTCYEELKTGD
ncbi:RNA-binding S4 domain-containing protein [Parasphingorhabdus halotolerans]|uniref:RNA-binding S4 domain-containing protein n=1 Tax=Parasphingorhabdus halotolerans TaxID=2725558 RepID=A0A6H2DQA9_9SPHN|nr:RNA-binding S4 domain-containing protein [Parasphingorhabdus halotolerans]